MDTLRDNPEVFWGFVLALAVVLILTPGVGRFARILGVVDEPGDTRRVHAIPVPRLGGIALLLGIFVPALAFLPLEGAFRGILLGAAIATTVGAIDDFRGLPWWGKLAGQLAAASVAVGFGVSVDRFTFPGFGSQELPEWAGGAATLVWVVAIPIFDTSFVFAKRLKYRQPLYEADRTHLHHRFMNIGFSQQRAVVYMYVWCGLLAAAALARRSAAASGLAGTPSTFSEPPTQPSTASA